VTNETGFLSLKQKFIWFIFQPFRLSLMIQVKLPGASLQHQNSWELAAFKNGRIDDPVYTYLLERFSEAE